MTARTHIKFGSVRVRLNKSPMVASGSHGPLIEIGGLSLWSQTNTAGLWNIASYHRGDSITWRWILSLAVGRRTRSENGQWPSGWFVWRTYGRKGGYGEAWALFGPVSITCHWQPHMKRQGDTSTPDPSSRD